MSLFARPRMRRHRCNGCRTIFDCEPCRHIGKAAVLEIFCSEQCKAGHQPQPSGPPQGAQFERYLVRAGIRRKW